MKTIAISNHKGGVGKTTTVQNLGAIISGRGQRVLMIDMDPQASLTHAVSSIDCAGKSMAEVLGGEKPGTLSLPDVIYKVADHLDLAPADYAMATTEIGLAQRLGREELLKKALQGVASQYDLAIIDCSPSIGLLTINSLVAAQEVIVPSQPSILDLRGVSLFIHSIESIRQDLNPELNLFGILVTQFDQRYNHHREAVDAMIQAGWPVIPVLIGRSVKVAEASGAGSAITDYDPKNPQSESYRNLADVVEEWLGPKKETGS